MREPAEAVRHESAAATTRWLQWVAISGVTATVSYVVVVLLGHGAPAVGFAVASLFAISLSIGSVAIWQLLAVTRSDSSIAMLAAFSNVVAAALFVAMVSVQLAVKEATDPPEDAIRAVYWGLDVAWDLYIGAGTIGFGIAVLKSTAFRWLAVPGVAIGTALLVLHVVTVPEPPSSAGLVDLGPLVGLWYTALTVRAILLLRAAHGLDPCS
jgi:hypothetical protein